MRLDSVTCKGGGGIQDSVYVRILLLGINALRAAGQVRLDSARAKAEAVLGQPDLSERGKAREVEKLYARARAGKGAKKSKPTRVQKEHGKQKGPRLDARLRADQRQVRLVLDAL